MRKHELYVMITRRTWWVLEAGEQRSFGSPDQIMAAFHRTHGTASVSNAYDEMICCKYKQPDGSMVKMGVSVDIGKGAVFFDAVDRSAREASKSD